MQDPSQGVHQQLLSHVHLVSMYKWPMLPHLSIETTIEYLLQAPKITREVAAVNWQFLDAPPDGTVMLVWQPGIMENRFASDGYVWVDAEQSFSSKRGGYIIERYYHRSGYHPGQDSVSCHQRNRYRLVMAPDAPPGLSPCDPSLWIVHYSRAEPQNQFPTNRIPVHPQVHAMMQQRRVLQQHGQLIRKDFMLHDSSNWPTVNLPGMLVAHVRPPGYPPHVINHLARSQQQPYLPGQHLIDPGMGPSPAKRPRQNPPSVRPGSGKSIAATAVAQDSALEDEEDTSRGDLMDFLTAREISTARFKQHEDWMEEVFASPYATDQILPVSLGLGRKGELEVLTKEFFESSARDKNGVGATKLGPGKAEDFAKRASEKVAEMNAEMERMKRRHAKRMAKITQSSHLREAEKQLRSAVVVPTGPGSVSAIIDKPAAGRDAEPERRDAELAALAQLEQIKEIGQGVEAALNRRIEVLHSFRCLSKGGLEEKVSPPAAPQNTATGGEQPSVEAADLPSFDDDFNAMADLPDSTNVGPDNAELDAAAARLHRPAAMQDAGDWVMVDRQGEAGARRQGQAEPRDPLPDLGAGLVDFDGGAFDDAIDFGQLDTAGEELGAYGADGLGTEAEAEVEDTAFEDAMVEGRVAGAA